MDFDLSPEQEQVRALARDFCDREVAPRATELDRTEAFPDELLPELFQVGFLAAPVPEEYGGMGLDYLSYGLIVEELGRADASIRSLVGVNVGLVALSILRWGTEEQCKEWLPRLGELGGGLKIALNALDSGRYSLAAGCTGIAQAALDAALQYADDRHQFGRTIASFQLVQELIADIFLDVEAARPLYWKVAWKHERGERHTVESSVAKTFCSEAAVRCADRAVQVHGDYGYIDECPVVRYLRDARVTTLYEGTSQIQRLLLGRHLTGENAFT